MEVKGRTKWEVICATVIFDLFNGFKFVNEVESVEEMRWNGMRESSARITCMVLDWYGFIFVSFHIQREQ